MATRARIFASLICLFGAGQAAHAEQQAPYAGKVLRLIINFAPGGAADTEGRIFAR